MRQALIEAFCSFAGRADVEVVAEGIEQAEELETLQTLGVGVGQGYHLGRPGSLDALFRDGQPIIDLVEPGGRRPVYADLHAEHERTDRCGDAR